MIAAIVGFAVILGGLFYTSFNNSHPDDTVGSSSSVSSESVDQSSTAEQASDDTQPVSPVQETQTDVVSANQPSPISALPLTIVASEEESKPTVDNTDRQVDLSAQLEAQLAAGEFGPALETAQSANDPAEQAALLKQVADAQLAAGELSGVLMAIRQMPDAEEQKETNSDRVAQKALTGGGTGADFDSLIDLIMTQTTGPWFDIDQEGGTISPYETGVRVDPNGMLRRLQKTEDTGRLAALGVRARQADLNGDMAHSSSLRLVSLTRLEREVARRIKAGQPILSTMKHLAGLSKVEYVFVYPEENEVVIGGPAESWNYDGNGTPIGNDSGRPILQLDDLVTVSRIFSPSGKNIFICSIVPRPAGMKRVQDYNALTSARGGLRSGQAGRFAGKLEELLGEQDIEFQGVPADSRVARVILDADYRMKMIGIGKLDGGEHIKSFFDLLTRQQAKNPPSANALRWWLTMKYDAILHSADRDVFEIAGASVLCQSENEYINAQGRRVPTGKAEPTNRLFAQLFTQHYAELAQRDKVFADLQNVFDLALVAALVRQHGLDQQVGWNFGAFAANGAYQPARFEPPKTVHTVANHRVYGGRDIIVQVAGGVRGDLLAVVRNEKLLQAAPRLGSVRTRSRASKVPAGRWWWDASTK
jgi:hypothetical protein